MKKKINRLCILKKLIKLKKQDYISMCICISMYFYVYVYCTSGNQLSISIYLEYLKSFVKKI